MVAAAERETLQSAPRPGLTLLFQPWAAKRDNAEPSFAVAEAAYGRDSEKRASVHEGAGAK